MLTPQQAQRLVVSIEQEPADSVGPDVVRASSDASQHRTPPSAKPPLPERIGPYRIIRLIAHGGMGAVYEGEQDHPHRRVAIKVMNAATLLNAHTKDASRRFHNEVEFLGRLEHPNIARLYDAGLHDEGLGGLPYFAMEYLADAQPITDFARENRLDIRRRLELFLQACDGVQHGHQRGVVHRDLKPSNILVCGSAAIPPAAEGGGEGMGITHASHEPERLHVENTTRHVDVPARESAAATPASSLRLSISSSLTTAKIIDFGVARATDADMSIVTQHTATGHLVGTLQYMSPEQCDGDSRELDTRSDVYALGAVLYELLCERLPYDLSHMTITGAAKIIQLQEPPAPHKWNRKLRGDLEAIILKAMHKNRDRRYGTAGELATDIRRHLNGEPIAARTTGRWMKVTRWMARHPVMTTAATCTMVLATTVVSSFVTSTWAQNEPAHFEIQSNGSHAILWSYAYLPLRQLGDGHTPLSVRYAEIRDRPSRFGGGKIALVVSKGGDMDTDHQLALYDINNLDHPSVTAEPPKSPAQLARPDDRYDALSVITADVLPEPGEEIVVSYINPNHSSSAIRIYDFGMKCLKEVWHSGPVRHLLWSPQCQSLICSGDLCGTADTFEGDNHKEFVPLVVFAVTPSSPEFGGWLDDGKKPGQHRAIRWYRVIEPSSVWKAVHVSLVPPDSQVDPHACAKVSCNLLDGTAAVDLTIDDRGHISTRNPAGPYSGRAIDASGALPPIEEFSFKDPKQYLQPRD